jgi:hypothetical protein
MSVKRWAPLLMTVALAGCTVTVEPAAEASGGPSASTSAGSSGPGCPWSASRGQAYEPETGRIKLVSTCLDRQNVHGTGGYVYRTAAAADRADQYTDGTQVAVLCVDPAGESYRDSAGHASKVWFKIDGTFATGDGQGFVPHAAVGYADPTTEDPC